MSLVNTSELYDDKYCKRIEAKDWRYRVTPPTVKVLYDHFKPTSVIDVGCANGIHLAAFKGIGVTRTLGIEGTYHWIPYIKKHYDGDFVIKDIREPLGINEKFDLVISFELLEHIEEEKAWDAAKNIAKLGDILCISACPIKGGFHHFNPKPKEYWIRMFKDLKFDYCEDEVNVLQNHFQQMNCSGWFKTGLKVFRRWL